MASLIPAIFCKHLRRFAKWHCSTPRQESCLPPPQQGSTGVQEWSCEDSLWRGLGIFPLEKQYRTHHQVFSCMKAIFIQFFYLPQYTNETILPLPLTTSLWRSWASHSDYKVTSSTMGQILGLLLRFFSFSYFTAKISFSQAICNYSWANVCTIPPETDSFPQPLVLPCRVCLAQNLILPWRSSEEAKVRCCDLTWL